MRRLIPTAVTAMDYLQGLLNRRWMLVALLLAVLPFSLHGAWQSWKSIENDATDWLPANFAATGQLAKFIALYGGDELLMISWDNCTLSDSRVAAYADRLQRPTESGEVLFGKVITGPAVLESFESDPLNMTRDEAVARMAGWIVSPGGEQTCVVALVSAVGAANRQGAIEHAKSAANHVDGLSADSIHMAGPTIDKVAIDRASASHLIELNLASFAICLTIMAVCLRNLRAALLVFSIALFNEQLSMALIYYCGTRMDSVLLLTANLTFVLSISIGIHLVNYYRDTLRTMSAEEAPARALYVAFRPTAIATVTTALGLASLGVSEIIPLKRFGIYSAASVLLASVTTSILIAVHFRIWPLAPRAQGANDDDRPTAGTTHSPWLAYLAHLKVPIVSATVAVLVIGYLGVQRLETLVGLQQMISPRSRAISDYRWLEQRIGPLIPVEVVLAMRASDDRGLVNEFRMVSRLHKKMQALDPSFAVISAATFAPEPPQRKGGVRQIGRATVFRRRLFKSRQELNELGYFRSAENINYWRLTLRAPAVGDVDYGRLVGRLQEVVDSTVATDRDAKPEDVIVCGSIPLIHQAQQQLLDDLFNSFALAFGLVGAALASLSVVLCSDLRADEPVVRGGRFALLSQNTKVAVDAHDVKRIWKQEGPNISKKTLAAFRDTFGITAQELASSAPDGMLRAVVSTSSGRDADLLIASVSPQDAKTILQTSQAYLKSQNIPRSQTAMGKHILAVYKRPSSAAKSRSIVHGYRAPFLILSNDLQVIHAVLKRLDDTPIRNKPPRRIAEALGKLTPDDDPADNEIVWYLDPAAWTPRVPDEKKASSATRRKAKAQLAIWRRHGLSGVLGIAGRIRSSGNGEQRIETAVSIAPLLRGTLKMFQSSSAVVKPALPVWIPRDVQSVATLYADVPGVLKHLGAMFDDSFADGIEGTYQQLLDDLRSELAIDLRRDLFPVLGPRISVVTAMQGQRPYQPMLYAFETSSPERAAKSLRKLMQDDPDAKSITIKGFDHPLWHAPPFEKGGEDFILMVAYEHLFYCNDMALMKHILKTKPDGQTLANDPVIRQQYQQLLADTRQEPCFLFARGTADKPVRAERPTPLEILLDPSALVPTETTKSVSMTNLFGGTMPWLEGHRLVAGYRSTQAWRFVGTRRALPKKGQ